MILRSISILVASFLLACSQAPAADNPARPNIVVILVDDMGFSDISCYGSEIPTPNLDHLAATGLRFTQFYNTGRCCPTRSALLTGLYSHQAGVGLMVGNQGVPGYLGHLNDQCVTLAEVLGPAGYFTAMSGKWHVGQEQGVTPWSRGFDRSLNAPDGGFYFPADQRAELYLNGKRLANDAPELPKNWYTTDLWTDYGIKFIHEAMDEKKPFLLYLAYNAPHFPLEAPPEDIARFRGKYQVGWDQLREQRLERERKMGVLDPVWALSPRPEAVKAWDELKPDKRDYFDHIMSIYAACVVHMDAAVGRLVADLEKSGVLDNTLIVFMSDNGGNAESGPSGRLEGDDPGGPRSQVYCGQSWATLENTPFRRYKHFNHEGGVATPFIVHWPAKIKDPGAFRSQMGHVIDIMPTCVEVAGATYPADFKGHKILPMEGRSLIPAFDNHPIERDALYWEHEGNAAIREGDWKLVRAGRNGPWELYDMKADRTELHDLSTTETDRAHSLAEKWDAWAVRAQVKPYPNGKRAGADPEKSPTSEVRPGD